MSENQPEIPAETTAQPASAGESRLDIVTALEIHIKTLGKPLKALSRIVDADSEFALSDWLMMGALALEYRPDFILEIGRGSGGTTCMLLEVLQSLEAELLSFETTSSAWDELEPKLQAKMPEEWFSKLILIDLPTGDFDFNRHLPPTSRRVLTLCNYLDDKWAAAYLERIFPMLQSRGNLVIMRGISDLRNEMISSNPSYSKFGDFQTASPAFGPVHDWLTKNHVALQSPPTDVAAAMHRNPRGWQLMRRSLAGYAYPLIGRGGHWVYFQVPKS